MARPRPRPTCGGDRRYAGGGTPLTTRTRILAITPNPAIDATFRLERLTPGSVNRATSVHFRPGGKGVNVAIAIARLGARVTAGGWLREDGSDKFEKTFQAAGIEDAFLRVPGAVRLNVKLAAPEGTTDVNDPGSPLPPGSEDALLARIDHLATEHGLAILSGSLPPGASDGFYARAIHRLRAGGCRVFLDASGPAFREGMAAVPDLVKPNRDEWAEFTGERLGAPADIALSAARRAGTTGKTVVVSMGADGAVWVDADVRLWAKPPAVRLASTAGAGDALVAGLAHGWRMGRDEEAALRFAVGMSAAKTEVVGMEFDVARAKTLAEQTTVTRL